MVQGERAVIKLASPDIREQDIDRAAAVLRSGNLIQGEQVAAFETALCRYTGVEHCAVVSSCTAALHLTLLALDIGRGDSVIVPAFTFPATANVVENVGAEVLMCDVDRNSYVVTADGVLDALQSNRNKKIKAVIVVHEFGMPADIRQIADVCKNHGLFLVEDAACALGTVAGGFMPGHFSDAACYSFHPRKALTTGEGGAVVSRSESIVARVSMLRNHGISKTGEVIDFEEAGLNYRMTDFQAALGLSQMERFPQELSARKRLAEAYRTGLGPCAAIRPPCSEEGHSWQSYMVTLEQGINRDDVIKKMLAAGIQTNLGAQALNCLAFYRKKYGINGETCENATFLYRQGLVLPLYGKLTTADIDFVCAAVRGTLDPRP
jgi:perosamine synthetase